jgi:hypothetical protein
MKHKAQCQQALSLACVAVHDSLRVYVCVFVCVCACGEAHSMGNVSL